jgi:hypothetical protein
VLSLPFVGVPTAAATNVTGVYVVGRRAQLFARDDAGVEVLGTWRSSVKKFVMPEEMNQLSMLLAERASHIPSADAVRATASRLALKLGESGKKLVSYVSSSLASAGGGTSSTTGNTS